MDLDLEELSETFDDFCDSNTESSSMKMNKRIIFSYLMHPIGSETVLKNLWRWGRFI